uniref:Uncharacterized protein n=1 Tax=Arundo donax TaxID=35708 RepID=A0A0A9GZM1_ARUDO
MLMCASFIFCTSMSVWWRVVG